MTNTQKIIVEPYDSSTSPQGSNNKFWNSKNKDIISEKTLKNVVRVINFLKHHSTVSDIDTRLLFRAIGNFDLMVKIASLIQKGNDNIILFLNSRYTLEIAGALRYFLIKLKSPILPLHIQALALDLAGDIEAEMVAQDILGLIRQDLKDRHLILLSLLLDLLRVIRQTSIGSELAGSYVPINMMPIFFNMQERHIPKWRKIAQVFVEMILMAPYMLPLTRHDSNLDLIPEIMQNDHFPQELEPIRGSILEIMLILRPFFISDPSLSS